VTTVAPHSDPEARLAELGLVLPEPPPALANYALAVRKGDLLYLAGHAPLREGRHRYVGRVGRELSQQDGYDAARLTALNMLATIKAELGDLARVRRIVKVLGMVACTEDFVELPDVIDGATDLFVALWGDRGRPVRSAVGMQQLHYGMAVEIEGIVEIAADRGGVDDGDSADRGGADDGDSADPGALLPIRGPVEVQVTCGSESEAAAIADRLVEGGYAACVQSLPIASVYEWDDQVQHDAEVLLLVKTRAERFVELAEVVTAMHSYDLPAITVVPMDGTAAYVDWVRRQVERPGRDERRPDRS
jgi:uncharacterized protein involved in tolerance to divalent cations/enamine deaminase RidA (YjgF/YER057c/UK114 family)